MFVSRLRIVLTVLGLCLVSSFATAALHPAVAQGKKHVTAASYPRAARITRQTGSTVVPSNEAWVLQSTTCFNIGDVHNPTTGYIFNGGETIEVASTCYLNVLKYPRG